MAVRSCSICDEMTHSSEWRDDTCPVCNHKGGPRTKEEIATAKVAADAVSKAMVDADAVVAAAIAAVTAVKLTTTPTYPNLEIEEVKGVITSECVFGMNVFRDFFAGMTDFFGGRSEASQKVLRDARETCLNELKKEAYDLGADGVIGIDLDYSEISGKGKGMLFLVASGTAVKFKEEAK